MKSKFIRLNNINLHYLVGGKGSRVVILLPSLFLTSNSYSELANVLTKNHTVYVLDLYKGKSEFNASVHTIYTYIETLNEFLSVMNIEKINLIGISFSGLITSRFSIQYPMKIRKSLLISTSIVPSQIQHKVFVLLFGYIKLIFNNLFYIVGIKTNFLWFYDGFYYFFKHPLQIFIEAKIATSITDSEQSDIGTQIKVPTKLILATEDEFLRTKTARELHMDMPNIEIELLKGRHGWMFTDKQLFANKVTQYFK